MATDTTHGNRAARRRAQALARKADARAQNASGAKKPRPSSLSARPQWRTALLSTAAAGAFVLAQPGDARAQAVVNAPGTGNCANVGLTATCTGDLSNGVTATGPAIDTLNVNSLTGNIAPMAGTDAITFDVPANGNITVNSNTGPFQIITTGNADGINADVNNNGDITINSTGNIQAGGRGIQADVGDTGNIAITSTGNIQSDLEGIEADVNGNGNITINSTGNVTTTGNTGHGISAYTYTGAISVTSTGNVSTAGNRADAIGAYAYYGSTQITSTGNLTTTGNYSRGIYAYGYDGNVSVTTSGDISTTGRYSLGIHVNGGGTGSTRIDSSSNITTSGISAYGIYVNRVGPGNVSITSSGDITTTGAYADGIFGTHFGPGNLTINSSGDISARGVRAFGIASYNNGGGITVSSTGNITTAGANAYGIATAVITTAPTRIRSTGNITTSGASADGINAYSAGGRILITATGDVSTSGTLADGITTINAGGSATITTGGDVSTTGRNADGIDVNAPTGVGRSTIIVRPGSTITGGTDGGDGIDFQDGSVNRVFNQGTITTNGENAIEGEGSGNELVFNSGTVTGNIDLGPGNNAFHNLGRGLFNAGTMVNLGAGNRFTNAGTFSPGGNGVIQTTALTGNLRQTSTGTFAVDLNMGNVSADLLNVTGTAQLNGTVDVTLQNPTVSTQRVTILSAAGGTTDNGLALVPTGPALNLQLLYPNATDVVLGITVDFSPIGLNPNQTNIGNSLNALLGLGGGTFAPIHNALLNGVSNLTDYKNALDQLSPEIYLNTETATLFASEEFTNNLFSCKVAGSARSFIKEGQCLWVRPEGRFLDRDRTDQNIGFKEDIGSFSAGAQLALAPGWSIGGGLGYESASLSTDTGANSDSDRFNIGGALKFQSGSFLLAAAVSGGIAKFETHRRMNFGGFNAATTADHDIKYVAGQLRAAYLLSSSNYYAKPLVDLNVTHFNREDVTEIGGGAANLAVAGADSTYFSVTPALEIGGEFAVPGGSLLRPFVRAGVSFFNDDEHDLTARFAGAPGGVGAFAISSEFDDIFADIEAGVSIFSLNGAELTASYEGRISEDTNQHGFFLKGSSRF
ncbi:MAG: autotransporter domain-containing protein [Alphaproteobacteria bacterium]|nr:autotransporter domain-containing protein [Alphaproteobacteria bacterium]